MRAFASAVLGVFAASVLVACSGAPGAAPTSTPDTSGGSGLPLVHTGNYAALVLDDGDGPELCVGAVATSYPPQCGGPALIDWNWSDWSGHYADEMGVKFGNFWVAGEYDIAEQRFIVAEAKPADEHEWPERDGMEVDFTTPCLEPDGGWQVTDPDRTTQATMEQALQLAETLDGYAGAWVDQSVNPSHGSDMPEGDDEALLEWEMSMNDPMRLILNVRTTGDVASTDTALREVWGGMLCVSAGVRTQGELLRIQQELHDPELGMLGSWPDTTHGVLRLSVIFDDGTLQQRLDAEYGQGLIAVESVLSPWEG